MEDRSSVPDSDSTIPFQVVDRASPVTISDGVLRSMRSIPPGDFVLRIECFSSLSEELGVDRYKSSIFKAGGYMWRLSLYPNGDRKRGGDGYVSLYLVLIDKDYNFSPNWEVNVNFKLFVYDQIRDKYMTIQDVNGKVRRFHKLKTWHGFPKFMSLATLRDQSHGYLINDTCIFGAEVFVLQNKLKSHHHLSVHGPTPHILGVFQKLDNFSKLHKECYYSDVLLLGSRKWRLVIYPKGDKLNKGRLSLHLQMVDYGASFGSGLNSLMSWFRGEKEETRMDESDLCFPSEEGGLMVYVAFELLDQLDDQPYTRLVPHKFNTNMMPSKPRIKCGNFMLLSNLMDYSEHFLVDDTLNFAVGFFTLSEVKNT